MNGIPNFDEGNLSKLKLRLPRISPSNVINELTEIVARLRYHRYYIICNVFKKLLKSSAVNGIYVSGLLPEVCRKEFTTSHKDLTILSEFTMKLE